MAAGVPSLSAAQPHGAERVRRRRDHARHHRLLDPQLHGRQALHAAQPRRQRWPAPALNVDAAQARVPHRAGAHDGRAPSRGQHPRQPGQHARRPGRGAHGAPHALPAPAAAAGRGRRAGF